MQYKSKKVSYIMLSYNQSRYIKQAVSSALKQDYENIEFIFSDDNSTDDTFEKIKSVSASSNRDLAVYKNETNMGVSAHFNRCLSYASGDIIVVAAGDDISLVDRVTKTVECFNHSDSISMVSFNDWKILDDKLINEKLFNLSTDHTISLNDYLSGCFDCFCGASRAFRREVFDFFGNLNYNCPTEDSPYILRSLIFGDAYIINSPGIYYRFHDNNLSSHQNLMKIDVESIYMQYYDDLELAYKNGMLTEKCFRDGKFWVKQISEIRNVNMEPNGLIKIKKFFFLLFSNSLFRRYFSSRILNRIQL